MENPPKMDNLGELTIIKQDFVEKRRQSNREGFE